MGINNLDGEDENATGIETMSLILLALFILFLILTIGTIGYRLYGKLKWIDSFHNASMVLTATSLITIVDSYEGKIFSSFYNLLTGIFVLVIIGVVIRKALSEMGISNTGLNKK